MYTVYSIPHNKNKQIIVCASQQKTKINRQYLTKINQYVLMYNKQNKFLAVENK